MQSQALATRGFEDAGTRGVNDGRATALAEDAIVGVSPALRRAMEQVERVAATDSTVLLLGETGTGKELVATRLHQLAHAATVRWCASTARQFPRR